MTWFRAAGALAAAVTLPWLAAAPAQAEPFAHLDPVAVQPTPACGGTVRGEAMVTPVQIDYQVENGVRVAINYDAGIYDGSCALTETVTWTNLDTGSSGSHDLTAVSTIDGHYGFIGYANTTFVTGPGTVVVTLSSYPDAELRVTT